VNEHERTPDHLVVRPACAVCGAAATYVQLVPPSREPPESEGRLNDERSSNTTRRDPTAWRLIYIGIEAGNGSGDDISADEARRFAAAFSEPLEYAKVHEAGLHDDAGFCGECGVPSCRTHWAVSPGGFGHCPNGHGKSLDPHWSPSDYD